MVSLEVVPAESGHQHGGSNAITFFALSFMNTTITLLEHYMNTHKKRVPNKLGTLRNQFKIKYIYYDLFVLALSSCL